MTTRIKLTPKVVTMPKLKLVPIAITTTKTSSTVARSSTSFVRVAFLVQIFPVVFAAFLIFPLHQLHVTPRPLLRKNQKVNS